MDRRSIVVEFIRHLITNVKDEAVSTNYVTYYVSYYVICYVINLAK
jgi:hypothetical protein